MLHAIAMGEIITNLVALFGTSSIASTSPFYRVITPSWHIQGLITVFDYELQTVTLAVCI